MMKSRSLGQKIQNLHTQQGPKRETVISHEDFQVSHHQPSDDLCLGRKQELQQGNVQVGGCDQRRERGGGGGQ